MKYCENNAILNRKTETFTRSIVKPGFQKAYLSFVFGMSVVPLFPAHFSLQNFPQIHLNENKLNFLFDSYNTPQRTGSRLLVEGAEKSFVQTLAILSRCNINKRLLNV